MYEYKVISAPERADKVKGLKRPEDRFAHKVEEVLNDMAAAGWSFLRAETLPGEERRLLRSQSVTHNLLVFYREATDTEHAESHTAIPDSVPPLSGAFRHDPGPQIESPGSERDDADDDQRG